MSSSLTAEVEEVFSPFPGDSLIITAGNDMRSDDGVGPYIYTVLKDLEGIQILNGAYSPENIIDEAIGINPSKIIFIDAADFGGAAGEAVRISPENIPNTSLSTHSVPLSAIARIIESETDAESVFIGIQPLTVGFGDTMSGPVRETADKIIGLIEKEKENA